MQSLLFLTIPHLVCKCLSLCHQLHSWSGGNEWLRVYVCVMKQGRGSADAASPRAINQTELAAEPVQIGLISLSISRNQGTRTGRGRERQREENRDGGMKAI